MRRIILTTLAALSFVACSQDSTGPASTADESLDAGAFGTALTAVGGYEADLYASRLGNGLPEDLRLSDEQRVKIKALVDAFVAATRADREALGAILHRAKAAGRGNKARAEVLAILKEGEPIHSRLVAAEAKLKADIDAILTAEQKAWIDSRISHRCDPKKFPPLTDSQKEQIKALEKAFAEAHKADLDALAKLFDEAKSAAKSGKSREDVAKILEKGASIIARLATARLTLRDQLATVLTAEQKATGCLPLG